MNEVVYYYSNGSQSQNPVDIGGSTFEEWMICNQSDTMLSILSKFIESGKRLDTALWISEEIYKPETASEQALLAPDPEAKNGQGIQQRVRLHEKTSGG